MCRRIEGDCVNLDNVGACLRCRWFYVNGGYENNLEDLYFKKEKLEAMIKITKAYIIDCSTGCSCCCDENHYRGPYKTKQEAEKRMSFFLTSMGKKAYSPLGSQFASRGNYSVCEVDYEKLPDGRIILNGEKVYEKLDFIQLNEDGSLTDNDVEILDFE